MVYNFTLRRLLTHGGHTKGYLGMSGDLRALRAGQGQGFSARHVETIDFCKSERILDDTG